MRLSTPQNPYQRGRGAKQAHKDGPEALTHIAPSVHYRQKTLLRVQIETGRTHQIRVHLAHIGHPIIGDTLYGGANALGLCCIQAAFVCLERTLKPRCPLAFASLESALESTISPIAPKWRQSASLLFELGTNILKYGLRDFMPPHS